jgi:hypothetical protein
VTESHSPPLTRTDAYLLVAVTEARRSGPISLGDLIGDYDYLDHSIPTFDDVNVGLRRLDASGYVAVGSLGGAITVQATPAARSLSANIVRKGPGGVLAGMVSAVGATPYPAPENEDRSLGRLEGLLPAVWTDDVRAYRASFSIGHPKYLVGLTTVFAAVIALAAARARRRRGGPGR